MELLFDVSCEHVPVGTYCLLLACRNCEHDATVAWDSVVQFARVELSKAKIHLLLLLVEEASENLDGVSAFLVDVVARVSALQSLYRSCEEEHTLGSSLTLECEASRCCLATSARDEDLSFVLRVEVDEHIALHETCLHAHSTSEACLLVACEHTLQRSVLDVVAVENSQFDSASDAVVSTESCALSVEPFAVDISLDSVGVEVEVYVYEFVADHVHVALQDECRSVLVTLCSRLADYYVARLVGLGL